MDKKEDPKIEEKADSPAKKEEQSPPKSPKKEIQEAGKPKQEVKIDPLPLNEPVSKAPPPISTDLPISMADEDLHLEELDLDCLK